MQHNNAKVFCKLVYCGAIASGRVSAPLMYKAHGRLQWHCRSSWHHA